MLPLLFALLPALQGPQAPQTGEAGPSRNQGTPAEATASREQLVVDQLKAAFEAGNASVRVAALGRAGRVPVQEVLELSAQALKDPVPEVRLASAEGLRFNPHPLATRVLRMTLEKGKFPDPDGRTQAALVRALCQKADPATLVLLNKLRIDPRKRELTRAYVRGLGRLRHRGALAALISFMEGLEPSNRCLYMSDIRTSLVVLTGTDRGLDATAWSQWFHQFGSKMQINPFDPKLPELMTVDWYGYWQVDPAAERKRQVARAQPAAAKKNEAQPPKGQGPSELPLDMGDKRSRPTPHSSGWPGRTKDTE